MSEPLQELQGKLNDASTLLRGLQMQDEVGTLFSQLYSYASLRRSEDNANPDAQARVDRVRMLGTRLSSATAFVEPEILAIEPQQLRDFIEQENGLKLYEYYLQKLERRRPHVRTPEVEEVLALAHEATGGTSTVFKLFNDADLKFPNVLDDQGNEAELTHGRYIKFLESQKRDVREGAFKTMHGEYSKWRNTLAASLSGAVKANVFNARVRKYESALHAALSPDEIPTEVYTNLIGAVRERLPVLHRYLRLRKKLLGLDDLQMWDLYVPMVKEVEREIPYEEAKRSVAQSLQPMGEQYLRVLDRAFNERWIDVLENEGKTSGAFRMALTPRRHTS
jgi:oligoendopeptidase F